MGIDISKTKLTKHAKEQMDRRDITWPTVAAIIMNGQVDHRQGAVRFTGWGVRVVMMENRIITAYHINTKKEKRTRKAKPRRRKYKGESKFKKKIFKRGVS